MSSRHGAPSPGALTQPETTTSDTVTAEERTIEEDAHERTRALTASLPPRWRQKIRKLIAADIPSPEALMEQWATLRTMRDHYVSTYADECRRSVAQDRRASKIRAAVSHLPADDPDRVAAERLAAQLETAQPNHRGSLAVIGDTVDRERRIQDSLAVHNPSGHARIHVEIVAGAADIWSDRGDDTYSAELTAEDEAIIESVIGTPDSTEATDVPE